MRHSQQVKNYLSASPKYPDKFVYSRRCFLFKMCIQRFRNSQLRSTEPYIGELTRRPDVYLEISIFTFIEVVDKLDKYTEPLSSNIYKNIFQKDTSKTFQFKGDFFRIKKHISVCIFFKHEV